jgi:MFS family permease
MVAFIVFAYGVSSATLPAISATAAAALINLAGLPASILGNEAAGKFGRIHWVSGVMAVAGLICWIVGISSTWPWWLMLSMLGIYFVSVMADSAALTAGLIQATPMEQRGAALGVYSLLGFGAGCLAPIVFGITLDGAQSYGSSWAWTAAFGTLGIGGLIWSISVRSGQE